MNTNKSDPFILVIFGGSGDLARRKLIPAVYNLYRESLISDKFAVLSLGRKKFTDASFRQAMLDGIAVNNHDNKTAKDFCRHLSYQNLDMRQSADYISLNDRLRELDVQFKTGSNYLFYLATPPEFFTPITTQLAGQKLHQPANSESWRRVIIEKPFGHDLKSAQALNRHLLGIFKEDQLFRIDHYLGKETVQNILAFRFANGIFEPLWNQKYIDRIEITAAEQLGVEDRGGYYEGAGALRDMVQNHLLQIVATMAMEPPVIFDTDSIRNEKQKIFQSLRKITKKDLEHHVIRGQYIASTIRGNKVPGYRQEKQVNPDSRTETFVALKFFIDNWRWGGVPFYIRTGKRLPTRVTEVVIYFKETPHRLFKTKSLHANGENQLILRVQPDEGILLKFGMKVPGAGFEIKNVAMDFHYSDLTDHTLPDAYQRLLLDAIIGDSTLYARADGVEAAWAFIDPILAAWKNDGPDKIYGYPAGSWGPKETADLFDSSEIDWRYPCKNLTNEDTFCEL